jgi:DNA-binding transcriptional LysR family regulator
MQFELIDLRLFLQIVEAGSITHGARRAHLALAAASTRIRNLELVLGVPLLLREQRGIRLTPAGHTLAYYARSVFQQIDRLRDEFGEHTGGLRGNLRLFSNTNAREFLPEALSPFLIAHPGIKIDVEERMSYEIVRAVAEGASDIGIVAGPANMAGLQTFSFRTDRLVLALPKDHPVGKRRRISFLEALENEFVGLSEASSIQRFLAQEANRLNRRLNIRVRLPTFEDVCRMVEKRVGLAVVPESVFLRSQRIMEVRKLDLTDTWAVRELKICVRSFENLPPAGKRLVEHLKAS